MFNHLRAFALMTIGLLVPLGLHGATTVTLQQGVSPTAGYAGTIDTFVTNGTTNNADPSKNYGAAGGISVAAPGLAQGEFQSLLQFDVAAAKSQFDSTYGVGNWTVTNVSLKLVTQAANNAIFNSLHSGNYNINWVSSDTWTEGTGTPMLPTTDGISYNGLSGVLSSGEQSLGTYAYNGTTGTTQTDSLSLSSSGLLTDILNGSLASFDLAAADTQVSAVFNSRNFTTATNRPALVITADLAPEPGRLLLFCAGLLGLVGYRRRPKA